jgi:hypothetical protein
MAACKCVTVPVSWSAACNSCGSTIVQAVCLLRAHGQSPAAAYADKDSIHRKTQLQIQWSAAMKLQSPAAEIGLFSMQWHATFCVHSSAFMQKFHVLAQLDQTCSCCTATVGVDMSTPTGSHIRSPVVYFSSHLLFGTSQQRAHLVVVRNACGGENPHMHCSSRLTCLVTLLTVQRTTSTATTQHGLHPSSQTASWQLPHSAQTTTN